MATGRTGPGAGRPSKRYRVTAPEMSLELPVRHDDLLVTLLGKALSLLPDGEAEAMAEEVGVEYGQAMAAAMGRPRSATDRPTPALQRSFRTALHTVADALTAHGFAAHAERHGDGLRIVSDHCPFGGAAIEHPVICAVDRGLVRGMLGALYGEADAATSPSAADGRRPLRHRPSPGRLSAPTRRRRHYLDHASTSPVRPEARRGDGRVAVAARLAIRVGSTPRGSAARVAVEAAREQVAALLGARPRSVVFTSGATEAIAAACWGAARAGRRTRCSPPSSTRRCG